MMRQIVLAALLLLASLSAQAQIVFTSSSLVAGVTPVTCTSGTTGVLFQSSGKVGCNANFTTDGAGSVNILTRLDIVSAYTFLSNGFSFRDGGANPLGLGSGNLIVWKNATDGAGGTADIGLARNAAGVLEVDTGTAGAFAGLKVAALSATLPTATGTNVVCNTPGTATALSVQVSATGCAASSIRFKDAITAIDREKAFETVLALQPVSYYYKPEFNMGGDKHIGFTAEQVGSVDPSLITFEADGVTPHAVKYNEMAPLFAAAIQQLKAEIDQLRRR